jgi:AAA family ATP:ADP antiporter
MNQVPRLGRLAGMPGSPVLFAAGGAGVLVAWQVAAKATRDALFLSSFDVRRLPAMMVAASLLTVAFVLLFSRLLGRHGPARLMPRALLVSAALLGAEWALAATAPRIVAIALFLHFAVLGAPLVSGFWSLVNEAFDPHAAKRAIGAIGTGAALGGLAGGLLALAAARFLTVSAMLALLALLHAAAAGLVQGVKAEEIRASTPAASGLAALATAPYLRGLALLVAASAAIEAMLDYTLSAGAVAGGATGPRLMSFFALFHTGVGLLGIAAQGVLVPRALRGLGLARTAAAQPAAVVAGGLLGLLVPGVATAIVVRATEAVLHNSLFRSAYELFYTPLPEDAKRATKSFVDVGCDKLGAVLGGAVVLAVVSVAPGHATPVLFASCVALAAASLSLCRRLEGGYVRTLAESLQAGAIHLDMSAVKDATSLLTLTRLGAMPGLQEALATRTMAPADPIVEVILALASADPMRARGALQAQRSLDPRLVPFVIPLLRAQQETSADALRALRTVAPRAVGQIVDALVDANQPLAVRRRLPQVLKGCADPRAIHGLVLALRDESFDVRRECASALNRLYEEQPSLAVDRQPLLAAAQGELAAWPSGLDPHGEDGERRLGFVFDLLACALERRPVQIALWALRSKNRLSGTALEYLENVAPPPLFRSLAVVLGLEAAPRPRRSEREIAEELLRAGKAADAGPA